MKRLFLLLTVCASALYSSAGYRYVSQTSGDNNNDGLSWATAKKTIDKKVTIKFLIGSKQAPPNYIFFYK